MSPKFADGWGMGKGMNYSRKLTQTNINYLPSSISVKLYQIPKFCVLGGSIIQSSHLEPNTMKYVVFPHSYTLVTSISKDILKEKTY